MIKEAKQNSVNIWAILLSVYLFLFTLGIIFALKIPLSYEAQKLPNHIKIKITNANSQAESLEKNLIRKLDSKLSLIKNIKSFSTTISNNESIAIVELKNPNLYHQTHFSIQKELDSIKNDSIIGFDFEVLQFNPELSLTWQYNIITNASLTNITKLSYDLNTTLNDIECLEEVEIYGGTLESIKIKPNLQTLQTNQLSPQDLSQQIKSNNTNLTKENIQIGQNSYQLTVDNTFSDIENLRNMVIQTQNTPILLSELATVTFETQNDSSILRKIKNTNETKQMLQINIVKKPNCDIYKTEKLIEASFAQLAQTYPNIEMENPVNRKTDMNYMIIASLVILIVLLVTNALSNLAKLKLFPLSSILLLSLSCILLYITEAQVNATHLKILILALLANTFVLSNLKNQTPKNIFYAFSTFLVFTVLAYIFSFLLYTEYQNFLLLLLVFTILSMLSIILAALYQEAAARNNKDTSLIYRFCTLIIFILAYFKIFIDPFLLENGTLVTNTLSFTNVLLFVILSLATYKIFATSHRAPHNTFLKPLKKFTDKLTDLLEIHYGKWVRKNLYNRKRIAFLFNFFLFVLLLALLTKVFLNPLDDKNFKDQDQYISVYQTVILSQEQRYEMIESLNNLILQMPEVQAIDIYEGFEIKSNKYITKSPRSITICYKLIGDLALKRSKEKIHKSLHSLLKNQNQPISITSTGFHDSIDMNILSEDINQSEQVLESIIKELENNKKVEILQDSVSLNRGENIQVQVNSFELAKRGITTTQINQWINVLTNAQEIGYLNSENNQIYPIYLSFEDIILAQFDISEIVIYTNESEYSIAEIASLKLEDNYLRIDKENGLFKQTLKIQTDFPNTLLNLINLDKSSSKLDTNIIEIERIEHFTKLTMQYLQAGFFSILFFYVASSTVHKNPKYIFANIGTIVLNLTIIYIFSTQEEILQTIILSTYSLMLFQDLVVKQLNTLFLQSQNFIQSVKETFVSSRMLSGLLSQIALFILTKNSLVFLLLCLILYSLIYPTILVYFYYKDNKIKVVL
jgi:multidrug efflux pump subunit AcrB